MNRKISIRPRAWGSRLAITMLSAGALWATAGTTLAADNGPTHTGEICMQKVYGTPVSNANKLNCTANDIRLSRAISTSPSSCVRGTTFDLTATFETIVTANARYDAGFFFRIDGGSNARGDGPTAAGQCSLSGLSTPPPPNPPALNLDGDSSGDLNAGTYNVTFTIPGVLCEDSDNDGLLNLPNCTSWHSNQGTFSNISNPFTFNPDTKSKCVCDDTFEVPVRVENATLSVVKAASPDQVPEPGGTVTFSVTVTNTAAVELVNITSIIDNPFGNVGTNAPGYSYNTCPALIGTALAAGASASCEFSVMVTGNAGDRVTDTVTVSAVQPSTNQTISGSDDAYVDIIDEFAAPTLTKTAQSTANCRLDATYQVVVSNNSEFDTLTVNALTDDKFGDITTVHAAGNGFGQVVSTTCAPPANPIAPLGNFTCSFVGRITSNACDLTHTNTVTADVTDDDGVDSTPSDDATVTVNTTP